MAVEQVHYSLYLSALEKAKEGNDLEQREDICLQRLRKYRPGRSPGKMPGMRSRPRQIFTKSYSLGRKVESFIRH